MSAKPALNIGAIERELAHVWREEAMGEDEERADTRARVLTLLVYNDDPDAEQSINETLMRVTEMHPARALVMTVDRAAAEPSVTAAVTAYCQVQGPRAKQVCCEQVTFRAAGPAVNDLPSAVAQLLAEDVPVYLWWRALPDINDYVFNHLVQMADRVIIDLAGSVHPRGDLVRLAKVLEANPHWTHLTDFTWQRLTPWRQMFASFYDVAEYRPYLDRVDEVTIEYVPQAGTHNISARAVLLASWLAERLDWKLDAAASDADGDENLFEFTAGARAIRVRFTPVERDGMDGLISSVSLGVSGEPAASFVVSRAGRHQLASQVTINGVVHGSRVLAYSAKREAELLATELGILARDRLYEQAVAIAAQMGAVGHSES
jgi:glucose-6-phosphate dehydrogenase assembly protein OpcA